MNSSVQYSLVILFVLLCGAPEVVSAAPMGEAVATERDRILVTVKQRSVPQRFATGTTRRLYGGAYRTSPRTTRIAKKLARRYDLVRTEAWPIRALDVDCLVFEVSPDEDLADLIDRLKLDPRVESAQLLNRFRTMSSSRQRSKESGQDLELGRQEFNDPYFGEQFGFDALQVERVHRAGAADGSGIKVAVVDTGVDRLHPDFGSGKRQFDDFTGSAAGKRAKKSGSGGDVHGTAIAGVIVSQANNGEGIVGIAPAVTLYGLKACSPAATGGEVGVCDSFALLRAIDHAIAERVDILNLSLSGPEDALLRRLLEYAVNDGAVVVAAMPEQRSPETTFPASMVGVIAVEAAREGSRARSPRASTDRPATIAAPGTDVVTTVPGGRYDFMSGSSLAAAHVSGVAALLLDLDGTLTSSEIHRLLADSHRAGGAMINACRAASAIERSIVCD